MFTEGLAGGSQPIVRPLWIGIPLRKPFGRVSVRGYVSEAGKEPARPRGDPCCFHDVKLDLPLSSLASATLYNSTSGRTVSRETVIHGAEGIQR